MRTFLLSFIFAVVLHQSSAASEKQYLRDADRRIPVSYETDVLILGGSTQAVAAAVESARAGAKTMLVTNDNYLGDDLTATLRLWKPENEKIDDPLIKSLYEDPGAVIPLPDGGKLLERKDRIPYRYDVIEELDDKHRENESKNRLSDGRIGTIEDDSLQTKDGPMTVRLDLERPEDVGSIVFAGFYRPRICVIETMTVRYSLDGRDWTDAGFGHRMPGVRPVGDAPDYHVLSLDVPVRARYWEIRVGHNGYSNTVFCSEIFVFSDTKAPESLLETDKPLPDSPPRPLHVKRLLDDALLENGVPFLYGVFETGTIVSPDGTTRGILINNRAGKQGIVAKKVVDLRYCDEKALRELRERKPETATVEFVVLGGEPVGIDLKKYPLFREARCERV